MSVNLSPHHNFQRRLRSASQVPDDEKLGNRGRFNTTIRTQTPRIKAMLTMLEPKTLPIETPTFSGLVAENTDTLSSGKDVAKPTSTNPIVDFPKPVISDTLIEFLIVTSLPITKRSTDASKIIALLRIPSCSNISIASVRNTQKRPL